MESIQVITDRETIFPSEVSGDIDKILLDKCRNKLEGKCTKNGYVFKGSINLLERSIGKINSSHFNGNIYYDVRLEAKICNPLKGDIIYAKIIGKNKMGILATRLPIIIALSQIHNKELDMAKLVVGDEIKVSVLDKKFKLNDKEIHVIGKVVS